MVSSCVDIHSFFLGGSTFSEITWKSPRVFGGNHRETRRHEKGMVKYCGNVFLICDFSF